MISSDTWEVCLVVVLQYVIDSHLDEVWHRFLVRLLADVHLVPNPYPRFLSLMRGCTARYVQAGLPHIYLG